MRTYLEVQYAKDADDIRRNNNTQLQPLTNHDLLSFPTALPETKTMAPEINWRTLNIDLLDPESSANFDISTLTPSVAPVSAAEVQSLAGQIRQLLRGGDAEGALRGALENAPYGGDERAKVGAWQYSYRECDMLRPQATSFVVAHWWS